MVYPHNISELKSNPFEKEAHFRRRCVEAQARFCLCCAGEIFTGCFSAAQAVMAIAQGIIRTALAAARVLQEVLNLDYS